MHSLRLRLFSFLLALGALVAAAVGGATYASVHAETDALFDYQLQQMALSLRDQGRISEDERAALAAPGFDYVVQVWSIDGAVLYSSLPPSQVQPLPSRAVLGFSTVEVGGAPWRVYGAATPLRIVQVGQPLAVRRTLAAGAAWRSVLPIALAAPLVALAMWWLVNLSLAPLARVAAAARARDAEALDALPARGLPSEVQPLVDAFNALLGRLALAFDAQRAFVADAAHELRTPLTALKLQLGLLRDAAEGPEREAALARLRSGIDRAARLVEQLLALARAEPARSAERARVDLAALSREVIDELAPLAASRHAAIVLDAPQPATLDADPEALRSMLRNLLDNALRHGLPDRTIDGTVEARVTVTVRAMPEGVLLQVDDSGPGIVPAARERVFDRFHRLEGTPAEGSGLGLAIVRAVGRKHGGTVALDDAPGGGLRVQVRLPRRPPP